MSKPVCEYIFDLLYMLFFPSLSLLMLQGLCPCDLKVIKQQQKLLLKLQKKMERETERRHRQERKKRRKEEEESRKEGGKKKGKRGKTHVRYLGGTCS